LVFGVSAIKREKKISRGTNGTYLRGNNFSNT